ncbi:Fatty acid oxidation complex subunit alpha [Basidiobolus ranarum]|uniref:Fatty acid oxidation complex subunit alpha n=1 Tax=Basidiobolus ranarum TaxID=34480 RepID=A0ABR2WK69_9FUNG
MVNDSSLKQRVNHDKELKGNPEKTFQPPNITIKELRDAVPAHCFERDTLRTFGNVAVDLTLISALFYAATYIDSLPLALRYLAWPVYWFLQGIVGTGVWVLAHEW